MRWLLLLLLLPLHCTNTHRLRTLCLLLQQQCILLQPCSHRPCMSIDAAAVAAAVPSTWCQHQHASCPHSYLQMVP
jgi:hypothetical protein